MILYPAIDLKDGQAVRLVHGDMDQTTVFNDNPAAQALAFQDAGCEWLHLVDLNGAFAGEPVNAAPVEQILEQCSVPAQLGGGIRDMATIEAWISKGLARVILGTVAVENPDLVEKRHAHFRAKSRWVWMHAMDAWQHAAGPKRPTSWSPTLRNPLKTMASPRSFTPTSTAMVPWAGRTSMRPKPWPERCRSPVIASGGVSSMDDLTALKATGVISGAISGRALYDGAIDLGAALSALAD